MNTWSWLFLIKAPHCNQSMYIIGRVNVNATAFSFSPLSLSVIQRHDLWLVSDFQSHPSSPGFTTGLHAVNHAEGLSFIPLNPSRVCFRVALRRKLSEAALEGVRGIAGASGAWGTNWLDLGEAWSPTLLAIEHRNAPTV